MIPEVEHLQSAFSDRYVIERELGRGGMATVYLARDLRHGRVVAIKVFRAEYAAGIGADRFRSEIEIAASLAHPGIVPVFDSGAAGDTLYYVMPFIEGESLRALLQRRPQLGIEDVLRITRDVGDALAYAHARGIVHRDIKPENILLVASRAVVADFGIARALASATGAERLTLDGTSLGTPLYMSPEQAGGASEVDGRSDVYSLGIVVYEMLAGAAPHAAESPRELLLRKLTPSTEIPPLQRLDVPAQMETAIRRALGYQPNERFSSMGEFVAALQGVWTTPATQPTMEIRAAPAPRARRRSWIAAAAAILIVAIGGVLWQRAHPSLKAGDGRVAIAVLPFRATVASAAEWAEAVPDLLTTALDGTPGMRVVDPWALWRTLRTTPTSPPTAPDPAEAARLAARAGASCFLLGSIANLQGRVEISVRVYRAGHTDPWQTLSVTGPSDSIAAVVQRLAIDLIRQLSSSESSHFLASFDHGLTRSPEALKAWLSARELRRRGLVDSADAAIDKAISLDSTFAFAMVDAVSIRSWAQFLRGDTYAGLLQLSERAVRLSDSLPERQRLRAAAMLASVRTEGARAAEALERIVALDSADVEAWDLLSYIDLEYGWQFGRGEREAFAAADQGLRLDSTDATLVARVTQMTVGSNDSAGLNRVLGRLRGLDTNVSFVRGQIRSLEALRSTDARFTQLLDEMKPAPVTEWISVLRTVRVHRPDRAEALGERMRLSTAMQSRRTGLAASVQVYAAEGRWGTIDSLRRTRAFEQIAGFDRIVDRMTVAAAVAGTADERTGQRAVAALAADMRPESARAMFETRPVWLEGWLIAAWNAMYGDSTLARRWDAFFATLPKGGSPPEYAAALRADIASRLAARRGDRAGALKDASRALALWTIHTGNSLELMPEPAMRFQLASLLRATGSADSAATLFRSLVPPVTWQGFYTARAALELGEIADARGDRAYAERQFLIALKLWERGDSSVASFRDRVRRGLARGRS